MANMSKGMMVQIPLLSSLQALTPLGQWGQGKGEWCWSSAAIESQNEVHCKWGEGKLSEGGAEQSRWRLKRDLGLERAELETQSVQECSNPYGRKGSSERKIGQKLAHMWPCHLDWLGGRLECPFYVYLPTEISHHLFFTTGFNLYHNMSFQISLPVHWPFLLFLFFLSHLQALLV